MRYYKFEDEYSPSDGGISYIEIDEGYAVRQITVNGENYIASNLLSPAEGLYLAEGDISDDNFDDGAEITQTEFETIWESFLVKHEALWLTSKQIYPIGSSIRGWIEAFYPQGTIVNLGDGTLGAADYAACQESAKLEYLYPGYAVTASVTGYDEVNHWLVLGNPRITGERLHYRDLQF